MPIFFAGIYIDDFPHGYTLPFAEDDIEFYLWWTAIGCADCYINPFGWEALGALAQASGLFTEHATRKYIAVGAYGRYLREYNWDPINFCYTTGGRYTEPEVIQMLQNSGAKTYIVHPFGDQAGYQSLAVGGSEQVWDNYSPIPMWNDLFNSVEGYVYQVTHPQEVDYGNPYCPPAEIDYGDDLQGSGMMGVSSSPPPPAAVPTMISTNISLESVPYRRYPCHNQNTGAYQTQDRVITIRFDGLPNLPSSQPYYRFIVRDLPDESPYARRTGGRKASGDNYPVGTGDYGSLDAPDNLHEHHGRVVYAKPDGAGMVDIALTITDRYAGNNYRIDCTPVGDGSRILASSPVIVAWKRVYLEIDRMYRKGSYLETEVHAGTLGVGVEDPSQFQVGDSIRMFDLDYPNGEERTIVQMNPVTPNLLLLDAPLAHSYSVTPTTFVGVSNTLYYVSNDWAGDAYGSANGKFTQPRRDDENPVRTSEDIITGKERGAFVDLRNVPLERNPHKYIPHIDTIQDTAGGRTLSSVYFDQVAQTDVAHIMAVDKCYGGKLLEGLSESSNNWSLVCAGDLGQQQGIPEWGLVGPKRKADQCLAHELGHQFIHRRYADGPVSWLNYPGHPVTPIWINASKTQEACLM